jgi:ribosome biogenesis protein BRX1
MNVHTMDELKLTGNCMNGSRPLLSFDAKFDTSPHWRMIAALFTDVFGTPRGHPKSKPFIDRYVNSNIVHVSYYATYKVDH